MQIRIVPPNTSEAPIGGQDYLRNGHNPILNIFWYRSGQGGLRYAYLSVADFNLKFLELLLPISIQALATSLLAE